ncbi:hypothetical protein TUM20985_18730 [Mycobacterium antarcticum]|uniref:MmpS family transport accessory protein n=1 Tax=Mycolicibacterium sp. TUM20985 TaxID=3023370 RepID=UPI0025738B9E|nr:MmpS family transport accessory protein [Mycolicibacterium sp. TUM20985]BDX31326.1 hypothetical protein TUM20985_18730 [Mycolicibacterium sp. TUM20985]
MRAMSALPLSATLGILAVVLPAPVFADPLPYGPDTCVNGFVWREARSGDTVCVTPATRGQIAAQNANAGANKDPSQASGPESCSQGYVWREAFDGDTICVTPAVRSATLADNAAAASRKQANQPGSVTQKPADGPSGHSVVFEVTGSGEVFSIDTDPGGPLVPDHTKIPWSRTMNVTADEDMLQVVAVARGDTAPGCRIKVDGTVVVEQPVGGDAHCIFTFN